MSKTPEMLKKLREENDLKSKEVANKLKITLQEYLMYENGNKEISFQMAQKLSKFYGVSLDYIAGNEINTLKLHISSSELKLLREIQKYPDFYKKILSDSLILDELEILWFAKKRVNELRKTKNKGDD